MKNNIDMKESYEQAGALVIEYFHRIEEFNDKLTRNNAGDILAECRSTMRAIDKDPILRADIWVREAMLPRFRRLEKRAEELLSHSYTNSN